MHAIFYAVAPLIGACCNYWARLDQRSEKRLPGVIPNFSREFQIIGFYPDCVEARQILYEFGHSFDCFVISNYRRSSGNPLQVNWACAKRIREPNHREPSKM